MMRLQKIILVFAMVLVLGCGELAEEKAAKARASAAEAKAAAVAKAAAEARAKPAADAKVIEKAIRGKLKKFTGELTKADLETLDLLWLRNNKLTDVKGLENLTQLEWLHLDHNKLTDVKGLEKLTHLKVLRLKCNPDLTKVQIDQLQKVLPKCRISNNPTK